MNISSNIHIKRIPRCGRGFTLVEVLVSLAVLILLVSVSVQGFANYARTQRYLSAIDQIKSNLTLVRQKTIASYEDAVYGVYVGTSTIEFFEGDIPLLGSTENMIIDLEANGITASSSFSNGEAHLTFMRITGEASATGTITVQDAYGSASTTFTIFSSGLVE